MFTNNWVKHIVRHGICQTCKQSFPGEGTVYTKGSAILLCAPVKHDECKGVMNG